ncbi:restriction endonuclease subunit S [Sulfitobacter sp. D35]|uniref:restriction endonuclease subunit S n=1 Tax=Sulfitobacter sp. D35 TaxID=3083252 RepID=UPI00296E7287|nr:restriction endonuclease subunit S [Sulfitobacter sp. D35]MDW4496357.1 restriction endonuclease subunit S [Sulfitobacter sp. D35]
MSDLEQMRREVRQRLIEENEFPHIPEDWGVERLRFLFTESKERNGKSPVGEMLSVSEYRGVVPREYENEEQKRTDDELENYRVVRPGQLAVNSMWLNHLGLGVSEHTGHVSPAYNVYDISHRLDRRFVHHLMRSNYYLKIYLRYLYGIRPNSFQIKSNDWASIPIIVPDLATQRQIADFLDRETARIDLLIEKKQRLVALLEAKREEVISNAIIKGLNPKADMRQTGIPWLGAVPSHWTVQPIKYLVSRSLTDGPHVTPTKRDEGVPFISAESISNGKINFDKKWGHISAEDHRFYSRSYKPQRHDIFVVKLGATTGRVARVETDMDFNIWVPLAAIRPKSPLLSKLIYFALQSSHIKDAYQVLWTYGTQQTLGLGTLSKIRLPIPPDSEIEEIANHIETRLPALEQVSERTLVSIDRLKEYRSALITAAVTGQIDVSTYAKTGTSDRRLDAIQEEMGA